MIVSILTRKVRAKDRAEWEAQLQAVLPKVTELLKKAPGFISVQYAWNADEAGEVAQTTSWTTLEDCQRYVREGGAATVGAFEDAAVPTASHPDGAWTRRTYESSDTPA